MNTCHYKSSAYVAVAAALTLSMILLVVISLYYSFLRALIISILLIYISVTVVSKKNKDVVRLTIIMIPPLLGAFFLQDAFHGYIFLSVIAIILSFFVTRIKATCDVI